MLCCLEPQMWVERLFSMFCECISNTDLTAFIFGFSLFWILCKLAWWMLRNSFYPFFIWDFFLCFFCLLLLCRDLIPVQCGMKERWHLFACERTERIMKKARERESSLLGLALACTLVGVYCHCSTHTHKQTHASSYIPQTLWIISCLFWDMELFSRFVSEGLGSEAVQNTKQHVFSNKLQLIWWNSATTTWITAVF